MQQERLRGSGRNRKQQNERNTNQYRLEDRVLTLTARPPDLAGENDDSSAILFSCSSNQPCARTKENNQKVIQRWQVSAILNLCYASSPAPKMIKTIFEDICSALCSAGMHHLIYVLCMPTLRHEIKDETYQDMLTACASQVCVIRSASSHVRNIHTTTVSYRRNSRTKIIEMALIWMSVDDS